jgi:hypothetical protein
MESPGEHFGNAADEVQACMADYYLGQSEGNAFIRHVRHTGNCPPSFVVYKDRTLQDIKNFCRVNCEHKSVLSWNGQDISLISLLCHIYGL